MNLRHKEGKEGRKEGRKEGNIYKGHQTTQEGDTQALAVEIGRELSLHSNLKGSDKRNCFPVTGRSLTSFQVSGK